MQIGSPDASDSFEQKCPSEVAGEDILSNQKEREIESWRGDLSNEKVVSEIYNS